MIVKRFVENLWRIAIGQFYEKKNLTESDAETVHYSVRQTQTFVIHVTPTRIF